jgi:hypothetical protein
MGGQYFESAGLRRSRSRAPVNALTRTGTVSDRRLPTAAIVPSLSAFSSSSFSVSSFRSSILRPRKLRHDRRRSHAEADERDERLEPGVRRRRLELRVSLLRHAERSGGARLRESEPCSFGSNSVANIRHRSIPSKIGRSVALDSVHSSSSRAGNFVLGLH